MVYVLHIGIRGTSINVLSPCKHFQQKVVRNSRDCVRVQRAAPADIAMLRQLDSLQLRMLINYDACCDFAAF